MASDSERRRFRRFLVEDCTVQCRPPGLKSLLNKSYDADLPVLTLSLGGVQFLTEDPQRPGEKAELTLTAIERAEPLKARGIVKWVECIQDELFRVGVAFENLSPDAVAGLHELEWLFDPRQDALFDVAAGRFELDAEVEEIVSEIMRSAISDDGPPKGPEPVPRAPAPKPPPPEPPEPQAPASIPAASADDIDRLLSKAISKQKKRGTQPETVPTDVEVVSDEAEDDDQIVRVQRLGEDDGKTEDTDGKVARYLEVSISDGSDCSAYRLTDDSMVRARHPSFPRGSVVLFVRGRQPMPGELALVETDEGTFFRQVFMGEDDTVRLRPLNPRYPEVRVPMSAIRDMSRAIGWYLSL